MGQTQTLLKSSTFDIANSKQFELNCFVFAEESQASVSDDISVHNESASFGTPSKIRSGIDPDKICSVLWKILKLLDEILMAEPSPDLI